MSILGTGLGIALLVVAVAAASVGWLAQSWKHRSGLTWGFSSFFVMLAAFLFLLWGIFADNPRLYGLYADNPHLLGERAPFVAVGALLIGGVPLMLAVAILPKRKPNPRGLREATKTCPQCAETVKAAATVCRFCSHKFPEPASSPVLAA